MPDRAIIPLVCGGSAGFLCGLIASVLEMSGGGAVTLAIVCGVAAALAGAASTIRAPGAPEDRQPVMLLRAALAAAYAIALYYATFVFLRNGQLVLAFVLALGAGFFAYCITQIRVRSRDELGLG